MPLNRMTVIWFTNLNEEGIREFYDLYADKIRKTEQPEKSSENGRVVFRIDCRFSFFNFRDGACMWTATGDKHHVLYRGNFMPTTQK
jgi:hypothetical protein